MKKIITLLMLFVVAITARAEFTYNDNGLFTVVSEGNMSVHITRDYGGSSDFGYYKYNAETGERGELISLNATEGDTVTIENLSPGEMIGFYTEHAGQGLIFSNEYSKKNELNMSHTGTDPDMNAETYNLKWNTGNNGIHFSIYGGDKAPSGQPLPGIIATVLVAGGIFAFFARRRK